MTESRAQFGNRLKGQREARALTLAEVARITKIPERTLGSLEAGDLDKLPAEVFVRGFLRSYCRTVGLDATEVLRAFDGVKTGTAAPTTTSLLVPAPARPTPPAPVRTPPTATPRPSGAGARPTEPRVLRAPASALPSAEAASASPANALPLAPAVAAPAPASSSAPAPALPVVTPPDLALALASPAESAPESPPELDVASAESSELLPPPAPETGGWRHGRRRGDENPILAALSEAGRGTSRASLTLAVIILVIVATLTLSLLLRRPSHLGDGVSALPASVPSLPA